MSHGVRSEPDVNVAATRDDKGISILVWHYHDDDEPGPAADVKIAVLGWNHESATLRHFRMDADHSKAFEVWKTLGKPEAPSAQDYAKLEAAGQLAEMEERPSIPATDGKIALRISLPRQGVSLLRLDWQ